jgi:hypothetical protein
MWGRVMSILLFLFGENQSKIQRLMLCFELERAHNIEPQTSDGANDERVNAYFFSVEARAFGAPLFKINVNSI